MQASLDDPPTDAIDAQARALGIVWGRHRDEVLARVSLIEGSVDSLCRGELDDRLRGEAQRTAHMLSGSLGMFGFAHAAEAAHELELEFADAAQTRAPTLSTLVAIVRRGIDTARFNPPMSRQTSQQEAVGLRMVVVDADCDRCAGIAAAARSRGMLCETGASWNDARTLCAQGAPAIVLIDLDVLEEEAGDASALLAELSDANPPVPVLVLTDDGTFDERVRAARSGSRAFLSKSLSADELLDRAEQLQARGRLAATRVLAVDDDPAVLDTMRAILQPHALEVFTLANPLQFWERLEEIKPELLILDVDMPEVNGLELCRTVRNDPRWSGIAVMFAAARSDAEAVELVFKAGADDYLAKPIVESELVARVSNRLERVRLYRAQAESDGLTGLSNRIAAEDALEQLAALSERFSEPLSIVMLDIDRFKAINDTHGHAAGDSVLRRLGADLRREFRGSDIVGRWGGEEFVIGMYGMTRENAVRRLTDVLERFSGERFVGGGDAFQVTFSAGIAEYGRDGEGIDEICQAADIALYRAKESGRGLVLSSDTSRGTQRAPNTAGLGSSEERRFEEVHAQDTYPHSPVLNQN
jgi:diguanylate cyclase (GGDEF)-like protein